MKKADYIKKLCEIAKKRAEKLTIAQLRTLIAKYA